jgi:hypothetical protein
MNTSYVVSAVVSGIVLVLLAWLSGAKTKRGDYKSDTFGGWTVLWSIFLVLATLIADQVPAVHNTVRDVLVALGRAGKGATEQVAAPVDPVVEAVSPLDYVEWQDTAQTKLRLKPGKILPENWRLSCATPAPAPVVPGTPKVTQIVTLIGVTVPPKPVVVEVYWDPDPSKLPDKAVGIGVPMPR